MKDIYLMSFKQKGSSYIAANAQENKEYVKFLLSTARFLVDF